MHGARGLVLALLMITMGFMGSRYYDRRSAYVNIKEAVAVLYPTKGNSVTGVVTFVQQENGVLINASVQGLTPGKHAFHIHEFGDCSCDDAVCAGEHFDIGNNKHGAPDSAQRHTGDLGNLEADVEGNAQYSRLDSVIALSGRYSIIGRSVIIHVQEDDFVTQPTGNAGARVACGVIGIKKVA